jgi:hypothetical protein
VVYYTDAATIGTYLGITLTPEQSTTADAIAAAATSFIDRYTARSWQAASPIVAEWSPIVAKRVDGAEVVTPTIYLIHRPAVAVTGVRLRATAPLISLTSLTPEQYELTDAANGVLRLLLTAMWQGQAVAASYPYADSVVALVDYTWAAAPPSDITAAATMIGATEMARLLALGSSESFLQQHPELAGLKSVAVGQNDVNVALSDPTSFDIGAGTGSAWAASGSTVEQILRQYRSVVIA